MQRLVCSLVLTAMAVVWTAPAQAQTTDDLQVWGGYFFTGQLEPKAPSLMGWADLHVRRGGAGTVLIFRPGVGYAFAPWISAWAGYAWVPTFTDATNTHTNEHRIWEQLTLQHQMDSVYLQSRTRLEQRFSDVGSGAGLRFRELVRANYQPWADIPFGLVVWDELFLGVNDPAWTVQGFDQNRLFIGPAVYAMPELRIEVGYSFVYLNREPVDQIQHIFGMNFLTALKPAP